VSALDPRYLVRLDILPPVSGAPVACMCGKCGAAWTVSSSCEHFGTVGALVECLDLSPPDVVDGVPVRLDALGWALDVLDAWYGDDPLPLDDVEPLAPGETLDAGRRRVVADLLRKGRPGVRS
jgi:hypothetical protein